MLVGGLGVEQVAAQESAPTHPAFVTHVGFGSLSELASGDTHGVGD